MELRRLVMLGVGVTSFAGAAFLYAAGQDKADANNAPLEQQLTEALKTRAESAQRAFGSMMAAFDAETVTLDTLADATEKFLEAELALATKPEEEIAAFERNVERTNRVETKIKALYEFGSRGGEPKEYFSAKRDRESAEIRLLKARIKAR